MGIASPSLFNLRVGCVVLREAFLEILSNEVGLPARPIEATCHAAVMSTKDECKHIHHRLCGTIPRIHIKNGMDFFVNSVILDAFIQIATFRWLKKVVWVDSVEIEKAVGTTVLCKTEILLFLLGEFIHAIVGVVGSH